MKMKLTQMLLLPLEQLPLMLVTQAVVKSQEAAEASAAGAIGAAQASAAGQVGAAREARGASEYGSRMGYEGQKYTADATVRGITETGAQARMTAEFEQRMRARERADQRRYARSTARAF